MAKMKGPDFKALLLNHGEKIGAVLVGLLGLTSLATANWAACDKDPNQLKMDADGTERTWLSSTWPEDQKKAFSDTPDVRAMAKKMLDSNDEFGRYATTRRWNEPINKVKDKLATAVVLPAEFPEASLVIFPNVKKDDPADAEETLVADATDAKKPKGKEDENTEDLQNLFGDTTGVSGGQAAGNDQFGNGSGLPGGIGAPGGGKGGMTPGGGAIGSSGLPSSGAGGIGATGRRGKGAGGMAGPGMGAPGMGGPGMGAPGMGSGMGLGMGAPGMGSGMGLGMGMGSGIGSEDGYGGASGLDIVAEKKVRSQAGVSVRYVFDIYRESEILAEALGIEPMQASQLVDFVNLQIERQRAQPGEDQWTGPWEPLPLKELAQILEESLAYDIEIVNPGVVRSEITMPLPRRAAGKWTPADASHKKLENYQLSEKEQEIIDRLQAKLREEADKQKAMLPPEQAANEGFRKYSFSTNDLAMGMGNMGGLGPMGGGMGSMSMAGMRGPGMGTGAGNDQYSSMLDDLYSELSEGEDGEKGEDGPKGADGRPMNAKDREEFRAQMRKRLAGGRLLLVRFMDFTCDRGAAYRYRVRLEMRNPNFNKPIDELMDPETAKTKTVFSPWSEPTEPVFVPDAYRYFPEKVESRPRADEYASMSMYYEHETAGTPVMAPVRVPVGTRIGGKQAVELVDLGKNKLELSDIELKSRDFLASVTEAPKINASDMPELKDFLRGLSGAKAVGDRLTVIDSNGAIVSRYGGDKVTIGNREISKADDARLTAFVLKAYEHLRPAKESDSASDPYGSGGTSDMGGVGGMGSMSGMGGLGPGMNFGGGMGRGSSMSGAGGRSRRGARGSGGMMPGMGGPAGK